MARRPLRSLRVAAALALAIPAPAAAAGPADDGVATGPVPDWVIPLELRLDVPSREVDVSEGMHYLLSDLQENVLLDPPREYHRQAWRVLGETGVQNGSSIRIEFDPSYERVVLHEVLIHRDGEVLQRLNLEDVRLLQREERLDAQIYDGTVTALDFVEGVHDGDVVEHSFTRIGLNPTFQGRWAAGIGVRWSVPVVDDHYRLLWPAARELAHRAYGTELVPRRVERGRAVELSWRQADVSPLRPESDVPAWYPTWPWIQLSEWKDWAEVAEWGRGLFEPAEPLPAELVETAAAWKAETEDPFELARRALRLVQDEVRYLGLEFGPNAYQPSEPAHVYERRFGDCKDKSVLLVQLLGELGLDAAPALVNTVTGRWLPERLPSPLSFDHAVVRLRLGEADYWLDATRIHERGPVARLTVPDWRWALVLEPGASGLTAVEPRDVSRTLIEELYESSDYDRPALFRVQTTYEGGDADSVRSFLAGSSREDVQSSYREYYSSLWAGLESVRPLEVSDDQEANVLVTTEQYRITDFWRARSEGPGLEASVWCLVLDDRLEVPSTVVRERPIGVDHPVRIEQRTELRLPEPWEVDPADVRVRDPAFRFDHEVRLPADGRVVLIHRYESLRDSVPPARAAEYRDAVERARDNLGFTLTVGDDASTWIPGAGLEWPLVALALVALSGAVVVALLLHARWSPADGELAVKPPGGWLLPLGLLVMASPLVGLLRLLARPDLFGRSEWRLLTAPENGRPLQEALALGGLLGGALLTGLGLLAGLQWAGRRRRARALTAAFLGTWLALLGLDLLLRALDSGDLGQALVELGGWLVGGLVAGLLAGWLLTSERVRGEFLR